jgi:glycine cleavage system H protein
MKANKNAQNGFRMIPEGDKRCVWMDLGVVTYKICDRDFDCDNCPLNEGLMAHNESPHHGDDTEVKSPNQFQLPIFSRLARFKADDNRYYHPNHTWLEISEKHDQVTVGIDDIVSTVFGTIDKVLMPEIGSNVQRDGILCQIVQQQRVFSVYAPISGEVVEINQDVERLPDKLVIDSMHSGWIAKIKPDNLEDDLCHCRGGDGVFPWYLKELEWFDSVIARNFKQRNEEVGYTMYDGGELSRNLQDLLSPEQYRLLVLSLLGEPRNTTKEE